MCTSRIKTLIILTIATAGTLGSCVTIGYEATKLSIPGTYRTLHDSAVTTGAADTVAAKNSSDTGIAVIPFAAFFSDPLLVQLIDSGIKRNNNLLVAIKQIDYASLSLKQARWGNVPTVDLRIGQASITRSSDNSLNGLMASQFLGSSHVEDYSSSFNISWEADIWGKIRSRKNAALEGYLQSQEAVKAVRTRLVSDIAQGYYNLLMLNAQQGVTIKSIALYDSTIAVTRLLRDAGNVTTLAVQQQEASREKAATLLPLLQQQVTAQENALSILTGSNPGKVMHSAVLTDLALNSTLPAGIPANMIALRPDIRQAELAVLQAHSMVNVSRASMYPSLSITAQGGLNTFRASNWFNIPGSLFGMATAGLTQPLLQGKRLKTQYEQSKIVKEQSELQFKQSVLLALGEVSNALVQVDKLKDQEEHTIKQSGILDHAIANARLLFESGGASYLEVLTAISSKLQADLDLATVRSQRLTAEVSLYQSLGGGWR